MLINTNRHKRGKPIRQRVTEQLEQQRVAREAACEHVYTIDRSTTAAHRRCLKCGATRSY